MKTLPILTFALCVSCDQPRTAAAEPAAAPPEQAAAPAGDLPVEEAPPEVPEPDLPMADVPLVDEPLVDEPSTPLIEAAPAVEPDPGAVPDETMPSEAEVAVPRAIPVEEEPFVPGVVPLDPVPEVTPVYQVPPQPAELTQAEYDAGQDEGAEWGEGDFPYEEPGAVPAGPIETVYDADEGATPYAAQSRLVIQDIGYFHQPLMEYGEWCSVPHYGNVWRPSVGRNVGWQPFVDGRWTYTDAGWTWYSNEPFGWATYHYGRWTNLDQLGWCWVPGVDWSPAPVTWRVGRDFVGWAPLPPRYREGVRPRAVGGTIDPALLMGVGPDWYVFVGSRDFGRSSYQDCYWDRDRRHRGMLDSRSLSQQWHPQRDARTHFRHYGPRYDDIRALSEAGIPRLRMDFRPGDDRRGLARLDGERFHYQIPRGVDYDRSRPVFGDARRVSKVNERRGWRDDNEWKAIRQQLENRKQEEAAIRRDERPRFTRNSPGVVVKGQSTRNGGPQTAPSSPRPQRPDAQIPRANPVPQGGRPRTGAPDLDTNVPMFPKPSDTPRAVPPPASHLNPDHPLRPSGFPTKSRPNQDPVRPAQNPAARPQTNPQAQPKPNPQVQPQNRPAPKAPAAKPQVNPAVRPQANPQVLPQIRPAPNAPAAKPQRNPAVRSQVNPNGVPAARAQNPNGNPQAARPQAPVRTAPPAGSAVNPQRRAAPVVPQRAPAQQRPQVVPQATPARQPSQVRPNANQPIRVNPQAQAPRTIQSYRQGQGRVISPEQTKGDQNPRIR